VVVHQIGLLGSGVAHAVHTSSPSHPLPIGNLCATNQIQFQERSHFQMAQSSLGKIMFLESLLYALDASRTPILPPTACPAVWSSCHPLPVGAAVQDSSQISTRVLHLMAASWFSAPSDHNEGQMTRTGQVTNNNKHFRCRDDQPIAE